MEITSSNFNWAMAIVQAFLPKEAKDSAMPSKSSKLILS